MTWEELLLQARKSAKEIEVLTFRIANGGRDWSAGSTGVRTSTTSSPTESAAMAEMAIVPRLEAERERHERVVGDVLRAIATVRERLGATEADVLEMFYIDGFLSWQIAADLGLTVDGVFYRKRKALRWMDKHLPMAG